MSKELGFLLAVGVSVVTSVAVLAAMIRPLRSILSQICDSAKGTQFWLAFTCVMLVLTPLLATLVGYDPATFTSVLDVVRRAAIGALTAAIAALLVIGWKIARISEDAAHLPPPALREWGDKAAK